MTKVRASFRFDQETLDMIDTMIPFVSSHIGVRLDRTKLLEKIVKDSYDNLLDHGVLIFEDISKLPLPNDSECIKKDA